VADGSLHVSFGVTEPDAGTDTTRITTRATLSGDGRRYVVNGKKVWTTKAQVSSKFLLLCRTTPLAECARPTDGMTLLLADLDPAHCDIREIAKMGRHAVDSNEVFIDELVVPVEDRVGPEGDGFRCLLDGLNPERILVAAEAVGLGRVALATAADYAKSRVVFGRPIGQNQGVAFPLAIAFTQLEAASLASQHAAWLYDQGRPCGVEANLAKYLAAEAAGVATDRAVQTLGGFGYAREYDVERYYRQARMSRLAPISQELVLAHLSQKALGLPRSY
jgi:acyl-CoA dehydrogenase